MTIQLDERGGPPLPPPPDAADAPRSIDPALPTSDHVFRSVARGIGIFVLVLTGSIGLFLGYQAIPTLKRYKWGFFTGDSWLPDRNIVGIAGALLGTVEVAFVAILIGFPVALLTALYISEYAPPRFKSTAIALLDLMAGVPSIIFGLWGSLLLMPQAIYVSRWISQNFGWVPFLKAGGDPNAATWQQSNYVGSAFIAGICVSMMIVPLASSVMRGVFALAPAGEREAAYALGSTRWGMIHSVVLPFGRGGIIGGTMLGLGRALGETVAVLLIISRSDGLNFRILTSGTETISALIANFFGEARSVQLSALLTAGFVLFVLTLGVNTIAAVFVARSRSGSATEI